MQEWPKLWKVLEACFQKGMTDFGGGRLWKDQFKEGRLPIENQLIVFRQLEKTEE